MLADGAIARLPNVEDGATQPADRSAQRASRVSSGAGGHEHLSRRLPSPARGADGGVSPRARRIIASSRLDDSPHVSPDGKRIAFESSRSGAREIWVTDAEGGNPRQVTFLHGRAEKPQWSPDGRSIAFDAFTSGRVRPDIYVIDAASGSPRALTADASFDTMPTWAADGRSLYFLSDRSAAWEIWNVPVDRRPGAACHRGRRVARAGIGGRLVALLRHRRAGSETARSELAPVQAADATTSIARFPADTHWGGDWTIAARGLYFLNEHLPTGRAIEFLPFRFGPPGTGDRHGARPCASRSPRPAPRSARRSRSRPTSRGWCTRRRTTAAATSCCSRACLDPSDPLISRRFRRFRSASEDFRKLQPKTLFVRRPAAVIPY